MKAIIFILLALMLLSLVSLKASAISFASDHLENDTLVLISGGSKIYGIRLQNPTDSPVSVKIEYDKSLMKVIDYKDIYDLGPKETGYSISFNVTAPKKPGIYNAGYTVMEVESSAGGGLPIRLKINRNFKLNVIEDPNKFNIKSEYVVYAVIALAFALYLFRKKQLGKRTKSKSRRFL